MASIRTTLPPGEGDAPGVRLVRATAAERQAGLALVLSGRADADDPSVQRFLSFCAEHHLSVEELWLAKEAGQPRAAVLLVPNPGQTAMVFLSPVSEPRRAELTVSLLQAALSSPLPAALRLAQALLEPGQRGEQQTLERAGFHRLARLVYMQRRAEPIDRSIDLTGDGVSVHTWREQDRPRFARVIEASYEGTLDCPGLLGLRSMDQVIEGHMATGRFDPAMWFVFERAGEPLGVMLINEVSDRRAFELVYLGVLPAYRGQGWGRRLLSFGLTAAAARQAQAMVLAVDESNQPAIKLYRSLGFRPIARKLAMIRVLT